ncbi:COG complex component [Dichomitus squalens LYAD-421 SS1]|uniref:Conserved oligomeric Golgi complex subunit 2 n=1 Tax=Dichomitus squalens (strain LYAD-421) TaxID=732165 RepID=R7SPK2_DICSQ|nr:COG complex component [Dichomitus squalens LYAD-421 SS1]EJF57655.1 COG complex component [Dichomitus squalens LYAD-421 SS1]
MASLKSPDALRLRDPFELDRLAEELEARESSAPRKKANKPDDDELPEGAHDLPVYAPLSHDNKYLSAETFDVEQFLLSRAYTSLPDLRTELRDYHAALKEELVKLINDDYEAFISLSTDLRGEGARLESMKRPLADLKAGVLEARKTLQVVQDDIKDKLDKRAVIREQQAFLQLLLKISESITRLESLLLITSPDDAEKGDSGVGQVQPLPRTETEAEDRTRGNRAKHIARVAAEYTQLLYHVERASTQPCAFIDEHQWRVERIKSTLSSDLDHLLATALNSLVGGHGKPSKPTDIEKSKLYADVTECLRTYDMLGLWRDAEDVLRREVVRDFVKKTIYPGALAAPRSPIVPHTPLPTRTGAASPAPPMTASLPPRTPYTPFTAFASKQNPFEFALRADAHSSSPTANLAHILDETDDPLAALYNAILRFVDRDMRRIMEIAEAVCVKSGSRAVADQGAKRGGEEPGFEIMANVVWSEIGRALMDELGSVIFAAGKPDEFRKHHETTQAFIRALEFLAPSVQSVEAMRTHIVFTSFERRWQLPVYFQLRWKEIVTKLEESLATTKLERNKALAPFATPQAAAICNAIRACWSAEVYIPQLSSRFWRLTLQILSRYRTWLDKSLPPPEPTAKVAAAVALERIGTSASSPTTRSSTPIPTEGASAESIAADDALLQQFATAITDIKALEVDVMKLWIEQLNTMLPDSTLAEDEQEATPEEALEQALSKLTSLVPTLTSQIVLILSRRGCDALLPMRSIPSQFRASAKKTPTEPSYFVSLIFKHTKAFFGIQTVDGPGAALKDVLLKPVAEDVFELVAQRYMYWLSAMKKTEEGLRKLKRGKKSYSLFGKTDDDGKADEDKIRTQMILDVDAFGREAESLGVTIQENVTYRSLAEMARSSVTEDT